MKEGYTKLGFCGGGGGTNPACCRYGWGFVQGANAAAAEINKNIEINYTWQYGGNFAPSTELQTLVSGWYENGTEVVFSCGGAIFQSIVAAAGANDGKVVGVDSDQSFESPETVVTSALKGVGAAASWAIAKAYDGTWAEIGNKAISLGAADNATGLPTETWSMKNYTVDQYKAQLADVVAGKITIDDSALEMGAVADQTLSNTTVNYVG